jgi:LmbE family N-acetylglucosaminyl deacetylase
MKTVLIISPHPDDDAFGCGGAIQHHKAKGDRVIVAVVTDGRLGSKTLSPEKLAPIREKEALAAGKVLGVDYYVFLRFLEGKADIPRMTAKIRSLIANVKPYVIYCTHEAEYHYAHQVVAQATKQAAGRTEILWYEVWNPLPDVDVIIDITKYIGRKMAALRKHRSQITAVRYDEAAKALNRYRGVMTATGDYAECFKSSRDRRPIPEKIKRLARKLFR